MTNNIKKIFVVVLTLAILLTVFHFSRQKNIESERKSAITKVQIYNVVTNYTESVLISYLYLGRLNDILETKDLKQIRAFVNGGSLYIDQTNSLSLISIVGSQYNKYYNSKISKLIKDTNLKLLDYENGLFHFLNNKQLNDSEIYSLIKNNNDLCKLLHDSSPFSLYDIERDYKIIGNKFKHKDIENFLKKLNSNLKNPSQES